MTKPTKRYVRPAKTQISMGIRPVWSDYSMFAWRKLMPRLIWVFAGRTVILLVLSWGGSNVKRRRNTQNLKCWNIADLVRSGMFMRNNGRNESSHAHSAVRTWCSPDASKQLTEKSRECHNHKPQPTPDTKRKRKRTKTNTYTTNKQMHEKHTDQLTLPQAKWSQHKRNDETRGQRAREDFKTWSAP